jgi:hypothetical protein
MNSQICLALCPQKAFRYCFTLKLIAIYEKVENSMATKVGEIFRVSPFSLIKNPSLKKLFNYRRRLISGESP